MFGRSWVQYLLRTKVFFFFPCLSHVDQFTFHISSPGLKFTILTQTWKCFKSLHLLVWFIIWLAPRAGKMNQIACCDWLPERARWSNLARSGLPAVPRKQNFLKSHIINPLLIKFVRSRWLDNLKLTKRHSTDLCYIMFYYMTSSVNRQDESNPALWLATREGKMELSCLFGTTRCIPQAKFHQKP